MKYLLKGPAPEERGKEKVGGGPPEAEVGVEEDDQAKVGEEDAPAKKAKVGGAEGSGVKHLNSGMKYYKLSPSHVDGTMMDKKARAMKARAMQEFQDSWDAVGEEMRAKVMRDDAAELNRKAKEVEERLAEKRLAEKR